MVPKATSVTLVGIMIAGLGGVSVEYEGVAFQFGLGATPVAAAEKDKAQQTIPAELRGFQGMMSGKLLKKGKTTFVFKVDKIMKVWKGNKAENPKSATGKTLTLNLDKVSDHHRKRIMKNYRELKNGDQIELEAFDLGGKTLSVKEWLKKTEKKDKRSE